MKVTMYELLGMVKDGKAPKKVKYKDKIYYYYNGYDFDYIYNSGTVSPLNRNNSLFKFSSYEIKDDRINWNDNAMIDFLNDEVEILEEEKKIPKKLDLGNATVNEQQIEFKINSIIDYLKSKGE